MNRPLRRRRCGISIRRPWIRRRSSFPPRPHFQGAPMTMVDLINSTLKAEMRRNPDILVFGEDVADCSREASLSQVKGKGGVFMVTAGIQREFGSRRGFNTPIAEASIVGRAIGMATRGLKPVPEIQFFDYIWPAMMQLRDELATLRWRSNGAFSAPAVIRVADRRIPQWRRHLSQPVRRGGVHASAGAASRDALQRSRRARACCARRCAADDPVLFLEHKKLYREPYNRSPHPGDEFMIPFGKAKVVKPGQHLTVITYGALVQKALLAATQIEKRNPHASIEVIDLRTLAPYDWEAIRASVEKTSRVIVAHEDTLSFGYGAEIAARIAGECFDHLDAPVARVGALDTWVGYHPQLEAAILPQTETLAVQMEKTLGY